MLVPIICDQIDINSMQFGIMSGPGNIDAIFILPQLQEKYLAKKKIFMFVNLKKALDSEVRKVLRWAMRTLGVGYINCCCLL